MEIILIARYFDVKRFTVFISFSVSLNVKFTFKIDHGSSPEVLLLLLWQY